jgi:hypothetical protein
MSALYAPCAGDDIVKDYGIGFSLKGLVAFMLVMVPNIIWMIVPPPNNPIAGNNAPSPLLESVLVISQATMIALLIMLIPRGKRAGQGTNIFTGLASICLAGYYGSWIAYYAGIAHPWILVGMAALPSVYFIAVGLWLQNYVSLVPSVVFAITHTAITCFNFL